MSDKEVLLDQIEDAMQMELSPIPGGFLSAGDIDRKIKEQEYSKHQILFASYILKLTSVLPAIMLCHFLL